MAAMYAVYHGPSGIKRIAGKVHGLTQLLKSIVESYGFTVRNEAFFDTLTLNVSGVVKSAGVVHDVAAAAGVNFRRIDDSHLGVTIDESVGPIDFLRIANIFSSAVGSSLLTRETVPTPATSPSIPESLVRSSEFLPHPVFNKHHSETEMLRYIHHLESKDLSLAHAMTPLGSCTMKLNSTSSMVPLTAPEFSNVHPFAPLEQVQGYAQVVRELESDLCKITGFHACSLQPNSGAAGEYAGLSVIRAYHESRGEGYRDICLIPVSAHGTNPAVSTA